MNTVYYHGYKLSEQASETLDWDSAEYLWKKEKKLNIERSVHLKKCDSIKLFSKVK